LLHIFTQNVKAQTTLHIMSILVTAHSTRPISGGFMALQASKQLKILRELPVPQTRTTIGVDHSYIRQL